MCSNMMHCVYDFTFQFSCHHCLLYSRTQQSIACQYKYNPFINNFHQHIDKFISHCKQQHKVGCSSDKPLLSQMMMMMFTMFSSHLVWMMNWAMWSTLTLMLLCSPLLTRISGLPPGVALTRGQKAGPDLMLGPILLIPVTRMSLRQFSAVSWVQR